MIARLQVTHQTRRSCTHLIASTLLCFTVPLWASKKPRISIITSVYNGDLFIADFLKDIVQQTIFEECELILINANSPGHEEPIIQQYVQQYPNIRFIKLSHDPGLYSVWNIAIKEARADYITNANLDDRLKHTCYEIHAHALDTHPTIDLVYSDYYTTEKIYPNFVCARKNTMICMAPFSPRAMRICLPNNHPMWRASLHHRFGYFDESYTSAGDWEMWLRAVAGGAVFLKIPMPLGICYLNPQGLSTSKDRSAIIAREENAVRQQYAYLWNP